MASAVEVADLAEDAPFDLVTVFEALHDMADPVGALRAARAALVPGGSVLVADERVAEEFTAPGDLLERFNCHRAQQHPQRGDLEPERRGCHGQR